MTHQADLAAKTSLRLHMRNHRRNLAREHPEAHWQAGDHADDMLAALKIKTPGVVALYRALGSEMDARPLADALLKLGWRLALPACEAFEAPVVFRAWKPGDKLAPDAVGVMSPLAAAAELDPDIVIVPLLAFDRHGDRLGQGEGYYDRTLAQLRARRRRPFIGLAFSGQEVERIPNEPHDEKLDAILTERGYRPLP